MNANDHSHDHDHGTGARLEERARKILTGGIGELLRLTDGLAFGALPSERHRLPLTHVAYVDEPAPLAVRQDVRAQMDSDPVSVLDSALALLELYESNRPDAAEHFLEDGKFLGTCFSSKRCNGWIAILGRCDREAIERAIDQRWQFRFFSGPPRPTGVYVLLSMLARYAYTYGRIALGDAHGLAHFVEDHCPGVMVCQGEMTDLEWTLALAGMKMGVPAVVPGDYPFGLGRTIAADGPAEVAEAVVGFSNIRRLLAVPDIPRMPPCCDPENVKEVVVAASVWGGTEESFAIVRKGPVEAPGLEVVGAPPAGGERIPLGIVVTLDAEPMDAFDREHIEQVVLGKLKTVRGVDVAASADDFRILLAADADLPAERIGQVLLAAVGNGFPRLARAAAVEVIFDADRLGRMAPDVRAGKRARGQEIESATEESVDRFIACTGCSPFAPDHVCVLTPQRLPQCGRPFQMIKAGALYAYDDMSNIHHSRLQHGVNSFVAIDKGRCIDPPAGEWTGANEHVRRMTGGRTRRVQLHSLDAAPHTGCGCFRLVMFKTDTPRPGIGVMDRKYAGRCPDGRRWKDLHYELAGKQTPGLAGASHEYLVSPKFLQAHGGWRAVVWVSPSVAAFMGEGLPAHVEVASEADSSRQPT